ncbi:MAG: MgtC/SapB family protein [Deltaproteobacteria bacterium]|nr:MgtC/SapB family protein [Deltaproteobacteria bacterium]
MHVAQDNSDILKLLMELGLALGIGILIGLERQLSQRNDRHGAGGIRTFGLVALFGFLVTLPAETGAAWLEVAGLFSLTALLSIRHLFHIKEGRKGITTEVSLLITFVLGMLVQLEYTVFAVAVALLMSFLLSIKPRIQIVVEQITEKELFAVFKFLVAGALILPLLPNRTIDPWSVLNPRNIWTIVVLVLSLSFLGYLLMKFWSAAHGILLTGFLGGLVSSTVVAWLFSNKSKQDPQNSQTYALATLLAISVMFLRIFVLAEIINARVGIQLLLPMALLCATGALTAYVLLKRHTPASVPTPKLTALGNPFNMGDAVKFAALFCLILVLIEVSNARFGTTGVYAVAALSGLASVDAIVVSIASMADHSIQIVTALNAVMIATLSNNLVKIIIGMMRGSPQYRRTLSFGVGLMFVVAAAWGLGVGW